MAFDALSARDVPVSDSVLAQLFTEARTRNGWSDRPVSEDLLRQLYDPVSYTHLDVYKRQEVTSTPAADRRSAR